MHPSHSVRVNPCQKLDRRPRRGRYEYRVGLDHISLGVPGAELERLVETLRKAGLQTRGIQRDALGPGLVCFRDPDNIAWECFQDD
ncbi:MAG: VOC family protein [Trebonia sp.]